MSDLKGKIGPWKIRWLSPPRGQSGSVHIELTREGSPNVVALEVGWRKDSQGIAVELSDGVYCFDVGGERDGDSELGGRLTYRVNRRESSQSWSGLSFLRAGEEGAIAGEGNKKKTVRIRAQMPGKIVRILVAAGAQVEKDQSLVVMEAMKMENEIRAPQAGLVSQIKVTEGQAVDTGADLMIIGSAGGNAP